MKRKLNIFSDLAMICEENNENKYSIFDAIRLNSRNKYKVLTEPILF